MKLGSMSKKDISELKRYQKKCAVVIKTNPKERVFSDPEYLEHGLLLKNSAEKHTAPLNDYVSKIMSGKIKVQKIFAMDKNGKILAELIVDKKIDYKKMFGVRIVGQSETGQRITKFCATQKT